jgi:GT2 family glycosyltransferase
MRWKIQEFGNVLGRLLDRLVTSIIQISDGSAVARKLPPGIKTPLRRFRRLISRVIPSSESYDRWVKEFDTLSDSDRDGIRAHIRDLDYKPLISVVMTVYETPEWALIEAIDSVRHQLYPNWELCIADDASTALYIGDLLSQASADDPRIKWVRREKRGNISAASNSALALARGEFVAFMDHDDLLPQHALYEVVAALNRDPKFDIIYSDEDTIDRKGRRYLPYFKTDWNIELLLGHNLVSHLGVYRRTLLQHVGGFREGLEGSQDYDVALRCADATDPARICHIPAVLYHWRRGYGTASFSEAQGARCFDAALRAIRDHLDRRHEAGEVVPHPIGPQWSRVIRPIPCPAPLVSLIIPTHDRADLLSRCINGLLKRTEYPEIEVLIVDHESELPETFDLFEDLKLDPRVRIISCSGAFNYSAINNKAVAEARGSIVGLINNDIDVINSDWLSEMVSLAVLDKVGAVGAKLIYPNSRVQHGGVAVGVGGIANHFNHATPRWSPGYFGRNVLTSSVSAVTGACLIVRKAVFEEVGGLNEKDLPVAFNDVDFCLKLRKKGYRNVWTPHAELYHYESASRGTDTTPGKLARFKAETQYMLDTWGCELQRDLFYNDNFSIEIGKFFQLAFPPRRQKPWLARGKRSYKSSA